MIVRRATLNSRAKAEIFGLSFEFPIIAIIRFCRLNRSVERLNNS